MVKLSVLLTVLALWGFSASTLSSLLPEILSAGHAGGLNIFLPLDCGPDSWGQPPPKVQICAH